MTRQAIDKIRPEDRRDAVWTLIRKLKIFTINDLNMGINLDRSSIRAYVVGLEAAGFLQREEGKIPGLCDPVIWRMVRDNGIEAPRVRKDGTEVTQGRGREQMWAVMKVLKTFTAKDIAIVASTDPCPVRLNEAKSYIQYLNKAGYLKLIQPAKNGGKNHPGRLARYRFIRNTGPKPPMIQRIKQVYDPNLKQVMWPVAVADGKGGPS